MAKSQRLSIKTVDQINDLLHDMMLTQDDLDQQSDLVLKTLRKLCCADRAAAFHFRNFVPGDSHPIARHGRLDKGWEGNDRELFQGFCDSGQFKNDVLIQYAAETPNDQLAFSRNDYFSPDQWKAAVHCESAEARGVHCTHDLIGCFFRQNHRKDHVFGLVLHRLRGDFEPRAQNILERFITEMSKLSHKYLLGSMEMPHSVSEIDWKVQGGRVAQAKAVLDLILQGYSYEEIGEQLGKATETVRSQAKRLIKERFGVENRYQLMALFIPRRSD